MKNQLKNSISKLKKIKNLQKYDEASTKQAFVLKLLSALGWDTFDVSEVYPEYPVSTYNIDYALRINETNKVFIEVKRVREDLTKHQGQLLKYSFQKGVKLSVLTNGISWWFYLPLAEGNWEKRKFYTIDILEFDFDNKDSLLIDILSKDNISSGSAIKKSEDILAAKIELESINKNLPKAWNKIIKDKNEFLIESMCEATEELCGYRPEYSVISDFLEINKNSLVLSTYFSNNRHYLDKNEKLNTDHTEKNSSMITTLPLSSSENSEINNRNDYTLDQLLEVTNSNIKRQYIEFRDWLFTIGSDIEESFKKTMGCYYSKFGGKKRGLVWIEPRNNYLLFHLRKGRYSDDLNIIKKDGWGGYPEAKIFSEELDEQKNQYIKDLIIQAYKM